MTGEQAYPLGVDEDADPRFSHTMQAAVEAVLTAHGYPPLTTMDRVDLQVALYRFLYRRREP